MNKEKYNQIIDKAYSIYDRYMTENFMETRWCKVSISPDGKSITGHRCNREEFIDESKNQPGFSERWGVKIEERELNKNQGWERYDLMIEKTSEKELKEKYKNDARANWIGLKKFRLEDANYLCDLEKFPTKLITLTYNNETIEVYGF